MTEVKTPPRRLVDLSPDFFDAGDRKGCGIVFDCPCLAADCPRGGREQITFANPLDGGPKLQGWLRNGDTFDTLTLSPSIATPLFDNDGNRTGYHWHGFLTNGSLVSC